MRGELRRGRLVAEKGVRVGEGLKSRGGDSGVLDRRGVSVMDGRETEPAV